MDKHIANLTNGFELYKYCIGDTFCYRVRNTNAKVKEDFRVHSSGFTENTEVGVEAIDRFMIHYLEDIITNKNGCLFTSDSYNVSKSFWH